MTSKKATLGIAALAVVALVGAGCTPQGSTNVNTGLEANVNTNTGENMNSNTNQDTMDNTNDDTTMGLPSDVLLEGTMTGSIDLTADTSDVKEIDMTSFYVLEDGQPKPQYSVKDIKVKKGDKVRINLTVTKGNHDFNLDEYDISENTPLGEEVVIEFTADQAGEFQYYCSMPNHRDLGHWGTLTVVE